MDSELKLLIAEDAKIFSNTLVEYFSSLSGYSVCGCACNGLEALEMIEKYLPDIVILDLVMPHLDGLGVLERVNGLHLLKRPQIIVMTNFGQEAIVQKAAELGAIYYILKPFDLPVLDMRIRQLTGATPSFIAPASAGMKSRNLEVTRIIHQMGVPAHVKGYQYLRDAIIMVTEKADLMGTLTKELYPMIAEKHNTTSSRVERDIRHAIELAWNCSNLDMMNKFFGYAIDIERDKPANSEFIATVSEKLKIRDKLAWLCRVP